MKNNKVITGAIVAFIVIMGGVFVFMQNRDKQATGSNSTGIHSANPETATDLSKLKGEDYDKQFLGDMIVHHTGAVEMADLVLTKAKHSELKELANNIITTQTKEKVQMTDWQKAWGYPVTSGSNTADHGSMKMSQDMSAMSTKLKDKSGDEFDKAFLTSMIEHHESAVAMSRPADTNASHQEVKGLAKAIITAQEAEITQMKKWQTEWGYES